MAKPGVIPWVFVRMTLGFIFLWAFFDKLFGLGFATKSANAWMNGGSPTKGFLGNAVRGPFEEIFHALAGNAIVDWLFMIGLFCIGMSLIFGVGLKIAGWSGALLMFFMWLSLLPPENNPVLDEHIVYMVLLISIATSTQKIGQTWGVGKWWSNTPLVQKYRFLE